MKRWFRPFGSSSKRRAASAEGPRCEPLEPRTLLASGVTATAPNTGAPQVVVVGSAASNPVLVNAITRFVTDFEAFAARGNFAAGQATLQADLVQISKALGNSANQATATLSADVNAVVTSGTLSASRTTALNQDLANLLSSGGFLSSSPAAATLTPISTSRPVTQGESDLTLSQSDFNAPRTATSMAARGQSGEEGASTPAPTGSAAASPEEPGAYSNLLTDVRTILVKTKSVHPATAVAVRNDFAAIAAVAHRPDARLVSALNDGLDASVANGRLTASGRSRIASDFTAVLRSAGVSPRLAQRTDHDLRPVLNASDLNPTDLRTMIQGLTSVLTGLPRATVPNGGLGAWFLGGRPKGM